jgi:hypothetical protein
MSVRLQFEIEEDWLRELEELQKLGGIKTKKELLNNAMTLLRWAAKQRLSGRTIVSVTNDGSERELEMPYLEAVASHAGDKEHKAMSVPAISA